MATTKIIQSIERAFAILELLRDQDHAEISLKEISARLGLNKSTTFGLVHTLTELGYLIKNETSGDYFLGLKFLGFSDAVSKHNLILQAVHPYLVELSRKYAQTVHCAVEQGDAAVYLDKVTAPQSVSINSQIGSRNDLHCTGVGKCILAYMPEEKLNKILSKKLVQKTVHTITDAGKLRRELLQVKKNGYALDREEIELGLSCVAVPVFSASGEVCCAISVSGLTPRIKADIENGMPQEMIQLSKEISRKTFGLH